MEEENNTENSSETSIDEIKYGEVSNEEEPPKSEEPTIDIPVTNKMEEDNTDNNTIVYSELSNIAAQNEENTEPQMVDSTVV